MDVPRGPYRKIMCGVYEDSTGAVVVNVSEVVLSIGLEDTPDNRLSVMKWLQEGVVKQAGFENILVNSPFDPTFRRVEN